MWPEVDKLTSDQKYQEAANLVAKIRAEAERAGNDDEITRALVREVQLRIGLGGYETAVRFLKEQKWPDDAHCRLILELYYARSLVDYFDAYSWEIAQREKVATKGAVDLKAMTKGQLFSLALTSYATLWSKRAELGNESVDAISEYLTPNSYPRQVRGTLRDALSYLSVEMLSNTGFWSPTEENDKFRLDLGKLLNSDGKSAAAVSLSDEKLHPIERIVAVLEDLENWHRAAGRRDAAIEARLARTRMLAQHFTSESQRAAIRAHLEGLRAANKSLSWWAMGEAQIAERYRDDLQDLVKAHDVATAAAKTYDQAYDKTQDNPGVALCRSIAVAIEAPDFQLSGMASDAPQKRSFAIDHRNHPRVYFRAYPFDVEERIRSANNYSLLNDHPFVRSFVDGKKTPAAEWSVELPATPDYKSHRSYVTPPLQKRGAYVVVASARDSFAESSNRVVATVFIVSDLVLSVHQDSDAGGVSATIVSGATGDPVAGANVRLFQFNYHKGHTLLGQARSDDAGAVRIKAPSSSSGFLIVDKDGDLNIDPRGLYTGYPQREARSSNALVYTDRGIYRPQQKILWKVVAYEGSRREGKFAVSPRAKLTVRLQDANGQEVAKKDVSTSEFGSAAGEFSIPTGRLLGHWSITARGAADSFAGSSSIRVEEYKRPTFEVSFKDASEALLLNRPAKLTGEAKYYFGLPVTAGQIKWRVERTPVYPWWWGCWYGWGRASQGMQVVAQGISTLDGDGHFDVKFTPEVEASADKSISYSYHVSADLTDEGGETRSASRNFRLGFVSVEGHLSHAGDFLRAGEPLAIAAQRTNLDGAARAGKASWKLFSVAQPQQTTMPSEMTVARDKRAAKGFSTPGDALAPRHAASYAVRDEIARWSDGAELAHGELAHGADGAAKIALGALKPGLYRVRYETVDDFGEKFSTWHDFLVAGDRTPLALPMHFAIESSHVPVGGTARLFISTGLAKQSLYLDRYREGRRVDRRRVRSGDANIIEVPIAENDRGGFAYVLWMVRDHQTLQQQVSVMVPWDNKQLSVAFSTFRDKMRPGGKETWRVTIKGPGQKALAARSAEVLAYMYDRSLDLFGGHSTPSPLSLFPWRTQAGSTTLSLSAAPIMHLVESGFVSYEGGPSLRGDSLIQLARYGIGGLGIHGYGAGGGGRLRGGRVMTLEESVLPMAAPAPPAMAPKRAAAESREERRQAPEQDKAENSRKDNAPDENTSTAEKAEAGAAAPALRSNFSETAFWFPQLIVGADGSASFEFTVPDSVTSWNVWAHGITKDLSSGSVHMQSRSVKELMVRPYLPRFFREGDAASVKVVINNAGEETLKGSLHFEIVDPLTQKSVAADFGLQIADQPFTVEKGKGTNLTFAVTAPKKVGTYAFKVSATAGAFGDGELRPLPVLPSRFHLVQSRFVTLRDKSSRTMKFDDLAKNDDPSRINDQMVVTVEGQLFYTVLKALPYLIDYPYECVEQTLNRFVSTGIVSSLYQQFPAVAKMAAEFSKRKTIVEGFDAPDANRKMTLEESPWLVESKGGDIPSDRLINALDPTIALAQRQSALEKLRRTQTSNGAFPWFPGGPPSPYMTLYLMHGFARASEFGVEIPKDMTLRAWNYLASEYRREYLTLMARDSGWEFLTFLNFVASSYPDGSYVGDALSDDERKQILAFSFKHWKEHSPLLKGMLALTLKRMGRLEDGKKVFASVMDSAKTKEDQGTFWAQEDRSWLWYNDTIETHAFALRVLGELEPQHAKRDGLVLWLLLNKKLNQWKSTRATAEVIYSLAHYLKADRSLGNREEIHVALGPDDKRTIVMEPEHYSPKTQIVIPGPEVSSKRASITVDKETKGFAFASTTWHFSTEKLPNEERGDFFNVSRKYFKRVQKNREWVLEPIAEGAELAVGDQLEVQVSLKTKHAAEYVHLRDPRGAGFEPENQVSQWKWDLGIAWYEETRDSGANFFFEHLPVGEYTFKYRVRSNMSGKFRVGPATVQSMYAPEFNAYSTGTNLTVK